MLLSLLLYPNLDSGSVTGRRPCTISMSGRPERSSFSPAMANGERKRIIMSTAGAATERQRARGGSGTVDDDLFAGDQGHLFPACLVLNADFSPLSYAPLSLWSWKKTVSSVFRGSAQVVSEYDEWIIRSPNLDLNLPSVIALKAPPRRHPVDESPPPPSHTPSHTPTPSRPPTPWQQYVPTSSSCPPAFTRRNVYLRDGFTCQVSPRSTCGPRCGLGLQKGWW